MLTPQTINALTALVSSAIDQTKQLFEMLETEQQALLSEDYSELDNIAEQKLRLSQSLDNIELQRQEIMQHAGQDSAFESMQQLLQANRHSAITKSLLQPWQELMMWLQRSADQNRLNGILLEKQRQHVKRALNILFEQSNNPSVYNSTGGTTKPKYTRSVGVA